MAGARGWGWGGEYHRKITGLEIIYLPLVYTHGSPLNLSDPVHPFGL